MTNDMANVNTVGPIKKQASTTKSRPTCDGNGSPSTLKREMHARTQANRGYRLYVLRSRQETITSSRNNAKEQLSDVRRNSRQQAGREQQDMFLYTHALFNNT